MQITLPPNETIDALVPVYAASGDSTMVCLNDGSTIVFPLQMHAFLRNLARRELTTLPLLRRAALRFINPMLSPPLRFNPTLLLTPLKMRDPLVNGDPHLGYINYLTVKNTMSETKSSSLVETNGGHRLRILWKYKTTRKHLYNAYLLDILTSKNEPVLKLIAQLCELSLRERMALFS